MENCGRFVLVSCEVKQPALLDMLRHFHGLWGWFHRNNQMLFLAQIAPSRVTRAHIFCEGAAQRRNEQNGVRNDLRRR